MKGFGWAQGKVGRLGESLHRNTVWTSFCIEGEEGGGGGGGGGGRERGMEEEHSNN